MSEEQLERSILERKASDELRAIATAMSLEPVARSRKADLVNQILRAAGVEVEDASGVHSAAPGPAQAPAANGAGAGTSPEAATETPATKPARGRTSRAKSAAKSAPTDTPASRAGSNGHTAGAAHDLGEGHDGSSPARSALVNGTGPASDELDNPVAEAAAAILASSDAELSSSTGTAPAEAGQADDRGRRDGRSRERGGVDELPSRAPTAAPSLLAAARAAVKEARSARSSPATVAGDVAEGATASVEAKSHKVVARKWPGRAS